jgi:hypothetical protein
MAVVDIGSSRIDFDYLWVRKGMVPDLVTELWQKLSKTNKLLHPVCNLTMADRPGDTLSAFEGLSN